jgi:acyl-CoA thioesterase YciA
MSFHQPVYVGDEVSCYCHLLKVGITSMTVHIETWVRRHRDAKVIKVTEATFTFVGIDENGRKRPLHAEY